MMQDLRYAFRMMRRAPLFTLTVVLTVAVTIAAETSVFSLVNAVLIRPLPYRDPGRIVQVAEKNDKLHLPNFGASVLNFLSWREESHSFEQLAAIGSANYTLTGEGEPEQYTGSTVSPALTRMLGVQPLAGRDFVEDEEKPNAPAVAMIGEGVWRRRFHESHDVIGRTVILNDVPTTIVGVAPSSLNLLTGGDIYTPLVINPAKEARLNHVIVVFGRLKPGVTLRQAQAEMDAVSARMGKTYPEIRDWGVHILSLSDTFISPQLRTGLLLLAFAVGFVLLIACANIANLLLARAAIREKEMATRTALGANRARLLTQLLIESVMLSLVGGAVGVLAAFWALGAINAEIPPNTLPTAQINIDTTVLWFAAALTTLTGIIFGLVPAWRMANVDLNETLKLAGRGSSVRMGTRLRGGLAATEIALAMILLVGSGLLIQSLKNLEGVHLGFRSQGLITFQLSPPVSKYPINGSARTLYRSVLDALQTIPGVRGAAVSSGIPFGAGNYTSHPMLTTGQSVLPAETMVPIDWRIVSPGYFSTMDIPLVRGRDFTDADVGPAPPILVSEATAKKFWGDEDPLGRTLTRSADRKTSFTVIGVVGDVRNTSLNQESPALYYPMSWRVWPLMDVVVRTTLPAASVMPAVRERIHRVDSQLALANVRTMDDWLSSTAAQPRLNTILLTIFAAIAMLIAAIGIYGVLAYSVNQRSREIGLRMALGATKASVLKLVVREGMLVALTGIGVGIVGGLALGRAISSLVFGVTAHDPRTFAIVGITLALVALAACLVPARRAAGVDPMIALRHD